MTCLSDLLHLAHVEDGDITLLGDKQVNLHGHLSVVNTNGHSASRVHLHVLLEVEPVVELLQVEADVTNNDVEASVVEGNTRLVLDIKDGASANFNVELLGQEVLHVQLETAEREVDDASRA